LLENPFLYLDFWFEDEKFTEQKRKTRLEACAKYRNITIAEQEMIYRNQNPSFFDSYLDISPNKIIELIKIAADFSDFYKSRGFKVEDTAIGLDLLPNGHWLLENLWNVRKYG